LPHYLMTLLMRLDEKQRAAIALRFFERKELIKEMAADLGLSEANAGSVFLEPWINSAVWLTRKRVVLPEVIVATASGGPMLRELHQKGWPAGSSLGCRSR